MTNGIYHRSGEMSRKGKFAASVKMDGNAREPELRCKHEQTMIIFVERTFDQRPELDLVHRYSAI